MDESHYNNVTRLARRAVSAARPPTRPPAGSVTDDSRRQTMTDASQQNNTGPLGGLVTTIRQQR